MPDPPQAHLVQVLGRSPGEEGWGGGLGRSPGRRAGEEPGEEGWGGALGRRAGPRAAGRLVMLYLGFLLCSLFQSGEMSQEVLPPAHSSLPALPERLGLRVMSTCSLSHKQIMSWSGFWQYSVSSLDFLLQSGCGSGCGRAEYQVPVMYKNTSPRAFLQGSQGHSLFCRQEAEA